MHRYLIASLSLLALMAVSCRDKKEVTVTIDEAEMLPHLPHVANTVSQYAVLEGGEMVPVQGYGVVIGLGQNGAREVPAHLRDYLTNYLAKQGIGSATKGLGSLSPLRMLQDPDTAVVLMGGAIPFGSPSGKSFDVSVTAMPNTQVRSLQGGYLLPGELRLSWMGQATPGGPTFPLAEAAGPVFVNPFIDPSNEEDLVRWREGKIIGGGKVLKDQPLRIVLRRPDYARADLIRRRINDTFPTIKKVADAKNNTTIELNIPPSWRGDYEHFLGLVMHISLVSGAEWERHAKTVIEAMELPEASHNSLSLILEAMGRQVIPMLRSLYSSRNSSAAFYAARAGARLKDDMSAQVLVRFAQAPSPLQVKAIEELGRNHYLLVPPQVLADLVNDENSSVRIAAYEAMLQRGDRSLVRRIRIDDYVTLDVVTSQRSYVIYATQSNEAKIVLFGKDMEVSRPIFFRGLDNMLTVRATEGEELSVFRRLPDGRFSDLVKCEPKVESLVRLLAARPDAKPEGGINFSMGLTYGQVLAVLYRMCENNDIRARFVLQPAPNEMKIYKGEALEGRPDAPGM
jgi:flagellar basal body P-ring protein FlgI